jgi:uncharacterized membrane protein YqhA
MLSRILTASRHLILLPVIGALIGALVIFTYDMITTIVLAVEIFTRGAFNEEGLKDVAISFIKLLDLFLLGTVLYIVSLGLYELFIDPKIPMPDWLLSVVAVLLVVTFLAALTDWKSGIDILYAGAATGIVVGAVALLLHVQNGGRNNGGH